MVFYSIIFLIKELTLQQMKCGNGSGKKIHRFDPPETSGLTEWWNVFWTVNYGVNYVAITKCWGKVLQKTVCFEALAQYMAPFLP